MRAYKYMIKAKLTAADKTGVYHSIAGAILAAYLYLKGIDFNVGAIDWSMAGEWVAGIAALLGYTNRRNRNIDNKPTTQTGAVDLPRGIRNNNPGNIRPNNRYKWQGQTGIDNEGSLEGYIIFDTYHNGLRAMALNLKNQYRLHRLNTIQSIINKYAPATDNNDPDSYAAFVAEQSGFNTDQIIDMRSNAVIVKLMKPMIRMENGQQPYSTEILVQAARAA